MNLIMQFATTHPWALALLVSAGSHALVYFPQIALWLAHQAVRIPWVQNSIRRDPARALQIVDVLAAAAKQAIADEAAVPPAPVAAPSAPPTA